MIDNIFLQLSILFGITVSIAFLMRLLRQPLVVAYIVAGLVAGPLFLDITHGGEKFFEAFATFGIVLLLFIVGLSLNFDFITRVGKHVFVGGTIQFLVTASLGFLLMQAFGFAFIPSLLVSIAITYSSTIIVVKLLTEKKDLESVYGRYTVGMLIVQDIIAILFLISLNTIATDANVFLTAITVIGKAFFIIAVVYFLSKYLLPRIMDTVATSSEMLFIFTIAWLFGIASLVSLMGLNVEIGAVIAGISLGASNYQREITSKMRPLRDFFIVLFFIVLGSELQIGAVTSAIQPSIILALFVLCIDPLILFIVMRRLGYTRRNAFLAGVTAAQVSEFGFIIIFKARELGYVGESELAIVTITALITIVISSYFITYNEQLYRFVRPVLERFGKRDGEQKEQKKEIYPVWIVGYHRIGWKIAETLTELHIPFAVIDFDSTAISKLKHRGIPAFFGDVADVEFLEDLPLDKTKMIISTIPEPDDQITMIEHVRSRNKHTLIIANLYENRYSEAFYNAGANYVMMPHLLGGQWISEILKNHTWSKTTFKHLREEQREEMRLRFTMGTDEA